MIIGKYLIIIIKGRIKFLKLNKQFVSLKMINGDTEIIAHIGFPTYTFKSPMIYNPYFAKRSINAVVIPMGCQSHDYPDFLRSVFKLTNIRGALITMPHKVTTVNLVDEITPSVRVAGACNAVKKSKDGKLQGDIFDGLGFVRGLQRKGFEVNGKSVLIVGSGGVGSAIAASLASEKISSIGLYDINTKSLESLGKRLMDNFPKVNVSMGSNNPEGYDLIVNATPLGMREGDTMPLDVHKIAPESFVGEVVLKTEMTAFLKAAQQQGCKVQVGSDMLFEQIPLYLNYFGFESTTPAELRSTAEVEY
jgi:shikimate dehydrogenase